MLIEDIVEHGVQLKSVETKYIHAEKIHDEVNKEFEITANIKGEILNSNTGNSVIQIKVCNNDFSVEIKKTGLFEFEKPIESKKDAILFLEVQGVRILWSYVREDLYVITGKMLSQPLMLPTIDVMKTLEKAKEDEN